MRDEWLRTIFQCLAGQVTPEALLKSPAASSDPEKQCEALYYAGEACLRAGRTDDAHAYFERCVATGLAFDPDTALGTR